MRSLSLIKAFLTFHLVALWCRAELETSEQSAYYANLYSRLTNDDLGFANFGEPCDDLTLEELEGFLDLRTLMIRHQEEDNLSRGAIKEHLRPKLKYFYDRLKLHCNYRQFQTCHKIKKTCVCAHSSMIPGNNGVCGYSLGKRCDFPQDRLISFGILMPYSLQMNVTCVGKAECVTSFGAAKKICRCPAGNFGQQCTQSSRPHWNPRGRSFGSGGPTTNDSLDKNEMEAFMLPNDIKQNLKDLMAFRGLFDTTAEREEQAEKLYLKMESDEIKEKYVIRDIFIRSKAKLQYGEACDPQVQSLLDNPPLKVDGHNWVDPDTKTVEEWQKAVLQTKPDLCFYLGYLRCDANKQVCECKQGLEYVPFQNSSSNDPPKNESTQQGECRLKIKSNCGQDYNSAFEFDPLRDLKRFAPPYSPKCIPGSTCQTVPLFFSKMCRCAPSPSNDCSGETEASYQKTLKMINSKLILELGDACSPQLHEALYNPQDLERSNVSARVTQLRAIRDGPENLCSLDKYLTCDEETKKCICFQALLEQDGECKIKNFDNCEDSYVIGENLYDSKAGSEGVKLWKIEEIFARKFSPRCVNDSICDAETSKCICTNGMAGEACKDDLSEFAKILNPYRVSGTYDDTDINEVFHRLNYYTGEIEHQMTLTFGSPCEDPSLIQISFGERLDRIAKFYREVGHSDDNIGGSKTLYQYNKTAIWAKDLVEKIRQYRGRGFLGLCNAFHGLTCHPATLTCRCNNDPLGQANKAKAYDDKDKVCKLNPSQECDESPIVDWMPQCREHSECIPSGFNFKSTCSCIDGWSGEFCQESDQLDDVDYLTPDPEIFELDLGLNETGDEGITSTELPTMYFSSMSLMVHEIINHRRFLLGQRCYLSHEEQLYDYFPSLPYWNLEVYMGLPHGPQKSYYRLKHIYDLGYEFCSIKDYMVCDEGWCGCKSQYHRLQNDSAGQCRIAENEMCGEQNILFDKEYPIPKCVEGTTCIKSYYGISRCLKTA